LQSANPSKEADRIILYSSFDIYSPRACYVLKISTRPVFYWSWFKQEKNVTDFNISTRPTSNNHLLGR